MPVNTDETLCGRHGYCLDPSTLKSIRIQQLISMDIWVLPGYTQDVSLNFQLYFLITFTFSA